jgi:hypothetical protein
MISPMRSGDNDVIARFESFTEDGDAASRLPKSVVFIITSSSADSSMIRVGLSIPFCYVLAIRTANVECQRTLKTRWEIVRNPDY